MYKKQRYVLTPDSDPDIYLLNSDFTIIVDTMKKVLKNDYPKLTKLRLYLSEVAKVCNKLNVTIPWNLPNGLRPNQSYIVDSTSQIKPFDYSKRSFTVRYFHDDQLNKVKQVRALMPNLIHSLDAASLGLLYNKYLAINNSIFTVHDCYAVPIPYVESLIELLQSVYLNIYSDMEYLKKFDKSVINNIQESLGDKLVFVDNVDDPRKSKYLEYQGKVIKYPYVDLLFEDVADFNIVFDALKNKKAIYTLI